MNILSGIQNVTFNISLPSILEKIIFPSFSISIHKLQTSNDVRHNFFLSDYADPGSNVLNMNVIFDIILKPHFIPIKLNGKKICILYMYSFAYA